MHCLRVLLLFYKNYMFTTMITSLKTKRIPWFTLIGICNTELHAHLRPHNNVWHEVAYCYFCRTTMFIMLFTC